MERYLKAPARSSADDAPTAEPQQQAEETPSPAAPAAPAKRGPLRGAVVLLALRDAELERATQATLHALGAKVLKRLGKSLTHCVFGAGGPHAVIGPSLDVGAKLVGPAWVAACEVQSAWVDEQGYTWKEGEAQEAARDKPKAAKASAAAAKASKGKKSKKVRGQAVSARILSRTEQRGRVLDVVRDDKGQVVFPFLVGPYTVHSLGQIKAAPGYFEAKYLYPVGYRVESVRVSYKHPDAKVVYTFEIVDGGDEGPVFRATCGHDASNPISKGSMNEAVHEIAERANAARAGTLKGKVKGAEWFGLQNATIHALVQQLPGVSACQGYELVAEHEEAGDGAAATDANANIDAGTVTPVPGEVPAADGGNSAADPAEAAATSPAEPSPPKRSRAQQPAAEEREAARQRKAAAKEQQQAERKRAAEQKEADRAKAAEAKQAKRLAKEAKKREAEQKKKEAEEQRERERQRKDAEKAEKAAKKEEERRKREEEERDKVKKFKKLDAFFFVKPQPAAASSEPATQGLQEQQQQQQQQQQQRTTQQARVPPDVLLAHIGADRPRDDIAGVPADYLQHFRAARTARGLSRTLVERVLKHWDDQFRPCRAVVLPALRLPWINGRRPFATGPDLDYEYESDDDWEGWDDVEEIVDDDNGEDEDDGSGMEEGVNEFIVPDGVLVMEDDTVVKGVRAVPRKQEIVARVAAVTGPCVGPLNVLHLRAAVVSPGVPQLRIVPTVPPAWAAQSSGAGAATATTGSVQGNDEAEDDDAAASTSKASSSQKRTRSLEQAHVDTLRAVLSANPRLSSDRLAERVSSELPAGVAPPTKKALNIALRQMADWTGKGWVFKADAAAPAQPQPSPDATVTTVAGKKAKPAPAPAPAAATVGSPKKQKTLFEVVKDMNTAPADIAHDTVRSE